MQELLVHCVWYNLVAQERQRPLAIFKRLWLWEGVTLFLYLEWACGATLSRAPSLLWVAHERKKELETLMLSMGGLHASSAITYVYNPEPLIR